MEYTDDMVLNAKYAKLLGVTKIKKKGFVRKKIEKVAQAISDNKFIATIVFSMTILIAIDIALVNGFMNLIITL